MKLISEVFCIPFYNNYVEVIFYNSIDKFIDRIQIFSGKDLYDPQFTGHRYSYILIILQLQELTVEPSLYQFVF